MQWRMRFFEPIEEKIKPEREGSWMGCDMGNHHDLKTEEAKVLDVWTRIAPSTSCGQS